MFYLLVKAHSDAMIMFIIYLKWAFLHLYFRILILKYDKRRKHLTMLHIYINIKLLNWQSKNKYMKIVVKIYFHGWKEIKKEQLELEKHLSNIKKRSY